MSQTKFAYVTVGQPTSLSKHLMKSNYKVPEVIVERKIVKWGNRAATKLLIRTMEGFNQGGGYSMFLDDFTVNI